MPTCFSDSMSLSRILADVLVYIICFVYVLCACIASYLFFKRSDRIIREAFEKDVGRLKGSALPGAGGANSSSISAAAAAGAPLLLHAATIGTSVGNSNGGGVAVDSSKKLPGLRSNTHFVEERTSTMAPGGVGGGGGGGELGAGNRAMPTSVAGAGGGGSRKFRLRDYHAIPASTSTASSSAVVVGMGTSPVPPLAPLVSFPMRGTAPPAFFAQQQHTNATMPYLSQAGEGPISGSVDCDGNNNNNNNCIVGNEGGFGEEQSNVRGREETGGDECADKALFLSRSEDAVSLQSPTDVRQQKDEQQQLLLSPQNGDDTNSTTATTRGGDNKNTNTLLGNGSFLTTPRDDIIANTGGVCSSSITNNNNFNNNSSINSNMNTNTQHAMPVERNRPHGSGGGGMLPPMPAHATAVSSGSITNTTINRGSSYLVAMPDPYHHHQIVGRGGTPLRASAVVHGSNHLSSVGGVGGYGQGQAHPHTLGAGNGGNGLRRAVSDMSPVVLRAYHHSQQQHPASVVGGSRAVPFYSSASFQPPGTVVAGGRRAQPYYPTRGGMSIGGGGGGGGLSVATEGAERDNNEDEDDNDSDSKTNDTGDSGDRSRSNSMGAAAVGRYYYDQRQRGRPGNPNRSSGAEGGVGEGTSSRRQRRNSASWRWKTPPNSGRRVGDPHSAPNTDDDDHSIDQQDYYRGRTSSYLNHVEGVADDFRVPLPLIYNDRVLRFFLFLVVYLVARAISTFVSVLMGYRSIFSDALEDAQSRRYQDLFFAFSTFLYYCLPLVLLYTFAAILEKITGNGRFRRALTTIFVLQLVTYWTVVAILATNVRGADSSLRYLGTCLSTGYVFLFFYAAYYFPRELSQFGSQMSEISQRIRYSAFTFGVCMFLRIIVIMPVFQDALSDALTSPGLIALYMPLDLVPTAITMYVLHKRQPSSEKGVAVVAPVGGGGGGGGIGGVQQLQQHSSHSYGTIGGGGIAAAQGTATTRGGAIGYYQQPSGYYPVSGATTTPTTGPSLQTDQNYRFAQPSFAQHYRHVNQHFNENPSFENEQAATTRDTANTTNTTQSQESGGGL